MAVLKVEKKVQLLAENSADLRVNSLASTLAVRLDLVTVEMSAEKTVDKSVSQ